MSQWSQVCREIVRRIVHLGTMQATANRLGLQRFMEVVWPRIIETNPRPPELWVVGNLDGASPELLGQLEKANAICAGYVFDLGTVLRPYDIHIVPWEHDTGTRTRIPLALNYAQALVSTRAGAACFRELRHNENCVQVDGLEQMGEAILALVCDNIYRRQLADAGRATFLRCYTREALQPRFDSFIKQVLRSNARASAL
ncbi:MAG: glycosyltransferase [Anaerolineae bacterium]|nr:glycosyltransferase [Anaerolineae bacterium]